MLAVKKNLKILTDDKQILKCQVCGDECSANAKDYKYLPDNYIFRCCGMVMELINK